MEQKSDRMAELNGKYASRPDATNVSPLCSITGIKDFVNFRPPLLISVPFPIVRD